MLTFILSAEQALRLMHGEITLSPEVFEGGKSIFTLLGGKPSLLTFIFKLSQGMGYWRQEPLSLVGPNCCD